jgi:CHAD domain-containing protein/adenylate cyclase class IV
VRGRRRWSSTLPPAAIASPAAAVRGSVCVAVRPGRPRSNGVRETLERELKLDPRDGFRLPALTGRELDARVFTSTYYDTPPRSLARAGITLRRRLENGVSLWQLKLPRDGGRTEVEVHGGPAGAPAPIARLVRAHLRHGELEPVATLRTRRSGVRVTDGEREVADVTVDAVEILDDGRSAGGFAEVEVELADRGETADLARLSKVLRRAGAKRSDGAPKLMRVLQVDERAPRPAREATTLERLEWLLARQLEELERYDPGVRLGSDAEDLHKFRVATRRTRALVRASRPLLGDALAPLAAELKWLAGVLGPVRDLDVLLARLHEEVDVLDEDGRGGELIVGALAAERDTVRSALLDALDSDRYLALLDSFETALASLPPLDAEGGVRAIATRELRRLTKSYDALGDDPPDTELHAVRIRAKRARYATELAATAGGKRVARLVDALKGLQDVIGEHQDAVVAEERVRSVATPESALAAGRLIELEHARRRDARADVAPAWRRVARAGDRAFG